MPLALLAAACLLVSAVFLAGGGFVILMACISLVAGDQRYGAVLMEILLGAGLLVIALGMGLLWMDLVR